jgi:DNA repair protein RadD
MDIELRPYQQQALDTIMSAIPTTEAILTMAATGAGKTIIFCKLIETILSKWSRVRIGILAHRKELITQAQDKLLKVWPEAPIGLACASTGEPVDLDKPVVIGSVQTLVRRIKATDPFDVIIVDEAHRIPPINKKSQYQKWLRSMRRTNPKVRILGFTATPFRLSHGYIYGDVCVPQNENLFRALNFRIGISQLQDLGFLCKYRAKEIKDIEDDLKGVRVSGDYNIRDLSTVMSRAEHVGSAVKAAQKYASDRSRIVVFCVTIAHAQAVMDAFKAEGYVAAAVHSKMPMKQRDMILAMFEKGHLQVLCNVGVLTEGWDSPAVDCIIMCRPTKSVGLYVQMVGRGLRPHPDKEDVLILDLSNNCSTHGDPDAPTVEIANKKTGVTLAPTKVCRKCLEINPIAATVCVACGAPFPVAEIEQVNCEVDMKDVVFKRPKKPLPFVLIVADHTIEDFISSKGNRMLKLTLVCKVTESSMMKQWVNVFFDFEGNASQWSQKKAISLWQNLVETEAPATIEEAIYRRGELEMSLPPKIEVVQNGKWLNVHSWSVNPWNESHDDFDYGKALQAYNIPF